MINRHNMIQYVRFQGSDINYMWLKNLDVVKSYYESSHYDRKLLKDKKSGKMFLYDYTEFVTFNDRGDITNELFILVQNEQDSDRLNKEPTMFIQRKPYIHVDNHFNVIVYE